MTGWKQRAHLLTGQALLEELIKCFDIDAHCASEIAAWDVNTPYALIEESRIGGNTWLTFHASLDDAGQYHVDQDCPADWQIRAIFDLRDGAKYEEEARTVHFRWHKVVPS